jgi:long-chain acyl-CoA synthetase
VDGWCHTGDVGMWDDKGRLIIIDRVKNLFKLAQGEYIAPEKIENIVRNYSSFVSKYSSQLNMQYAKHDMVAQAFVYGNSLKAALVGIIVPEKEKLEKWAAEKQMNQTFEELCKMDEVNKHYLKQLNDHGKENGLKGFENVKAIFLEATLFSVENNILTPTFKLKRNIAGEVYKSKIEELYSTVKD